MDLANSTLTAVPGIEVGHATASGGGSGCTVVLGPFRAAAEVRGMATGSREMGTLDPEHLVPRVDALLLTGGSAFGLAAADGVMAWLAERGRGFETGSACVPIVPTAVIFDLAAGTPRPDPALGKAACDAAGTATVQQGRVGAGAGATVGKLGGRGATAPGGVGSMALRQGKWTVGALVVVNALGSVLDAEGTVIAGKPPGPPDGDGDTDSPPFLADDDGGPGPGQNTTLAVVATDAPLGRTDLKRWARMASTAFARRIVPVHTPYDGDIVFAVSTAPESSPTTPAALTRLGIAARHVVEASITAAVLP